MLQSLSRNQSIALVAPKCYTSTARSLHTQREKERKMQGASSPTDRIRVCSEGRLCVQSCFHEINYTYILSVRCCNRSGIWSSGMILASGARGREFDSRNAPLDHFVQAVTYAVFLNNLLPLVGCYPPAPPTQPEWNDSHHPTSNGGRSVDVILETT